MGAGIAGEFGHAGCDVRLVDKDDRLLGRAMDLMQAAQKSLTREGLLSRRKAAAALKNVRRFTSLSAACDETELVIEAVYEDASLKHRLFRQLDAICPRTAVLASNTSGLSITRIAAATKRPKLIAGMHFWNPPHIIPLVEVTQGGKRRQRRRNG
jgi:3-hydroxybutyryl-CoA dehydrogenase